ncbi:MAG TPA: hypothetical protein VFV02_03405 [Acidimicrobiales bacterium]|nr:hypothetical protein [Acidimicrobiales bacterium]
MQDTSGGHRSLVVAGRMLLGHLGRLKLERYLRAMLLVRPARGQSMLSATVGNGALLEALAHDRHFCRDTTLGAMLHPKRPSFRELCTGVGLHIVLEPHNRISAHLDRETPAVGRSDDGSCLYTQSRTVRHVWCDVVPSLLGPGMHALSLHRPTSPWHQPLGARPLWRFRGDRPAAPAPGSLRSAAPAGRGPRQASALSVRRMAREGHPHRGPPHPSLRWPPHP